jgi:pimeloyl-ACP methyl ester carboxylesterase
MNTNSLYKSLAGEQEVMALYESALTHWPAPFQARDIPTRYGSTFVIAGGKESNPPLVLLHGASTNSATWRGDAAVYQRDYRVYAVDLLGEPGKSAPNRPAWDSPAYAEWLQDVLDTLKVEKTALIGISQGGWAALKFTLHQPERVSKLVLLCPGGITPARSSFFARAILYTLLGRWGIRPLKQMFFGDQPLPAEVDRFMTLVMQQYKARIGALPIFSDDELSRLTMPVLLIAGLKDALYPSEKTAARLQKCLPKITTAILPEAGHVLYDMTDRIIPFLAGDFERY